MTLPHTLHQLLHAPESVTNERTKEHVKTNAPPHLSTYDNYVGKHQIH